jgi:hypothetical protein
VTSISSAEVETAAEDAASSQPQLLEDEIDTSNRDDVKACAASKASNGIDDAQETEDNVCKLTQSGTAFDAIECEGEASGWIHVSLTTAGMEAVQAHPDIEAIKVEEPIVHCSELSKGKDINVEECTTGTDVAVKSSCGDDISAGGVPHQRRSRQSNGMYKVYPKASSDTKTTEGFLKSKVQPGTHIYQFSNSNGVTTAWWGLHLDLDSKVAVQNHEGVWDVEDDPGTNYGGAEPPSTVETIEDEAQPKSLYSDDNFPLWTTKSNANDVVGNTEALASIPFVWHSRKVRPNHKLKYHVAN